MEPVALQMGAKYTSKSMAWQRFCYSYLKDTQKPSGKFVFDIVMLLENPNIPSSTVTVFSAKSTIHLAEGLENNNKVAWQLWQKD